MLSTLEWGTLDGVADGLLAVLAAGASLVQCRNADPAALDRRADAEKVDRPPRLSRWSTTRPPWPAPSGSSSPRTPPSRPRPWPCAPARARSSPSSSSPSRTGSLAEPLRELFARHLRERLPDDDAGELHAAVTAAAVVAALDLAVARWRADGAHADMAACRARFRAVAALLPPDPGRA